MRSAIIFSIFFILTISFISAVCEENQIDINTASLEELDEIYGIGPSKAQAIIDYRESQGNFEILNDLIDVDGIGPVTLNNIKSRGVACVESDGRDEDNNRSIIGEEETESISQEPLIIELDTLVLNSPRKNSKDIKTNTDNELSEKVPESYHLYVFFAFCVLIIGLFISRKVGRKNEFG